MNFSQSCVLCIGSLHYDLLVESTHLPALGETIAGKSWKPKFGGKGGNQAVAAANAGAFVRMMGAVGNDICGRYLLNRLTEVGVNSDHVYILNKPTGMSVAISDACGDYGAVIVSGVNESIPTRHMSEPHFWDRASVVMLQNEVPDHVNLHAAKLANSLNIRVCLNAAPYRPLPDTLMQHVDLLVLNTIEAAQLLSQEINTIHDVQIAAMSLLDLCDMVIVTAGEGGVILSDRSGANCVIPARRVKIQSTHGAGDVFVGTLCANLAVGNSPEESTKEAVNQATRHVESH